MSGSSRAFEVGLSSADARGDGARPPRRRPGRGGVALRARPPRGGRDRPRACDRCCTARRMWGSAASASSIKQQELAEVVLARPAPACRAPEPAHQRGRAPCPPPSAPCRRGSPQTSARLSMAPARWSLSPCVSQSAMVRSSARMRVVQPAEPRVDEAQQRQRDHQRLVAVLAQRLRGGLGLLEQRRRQLVAAEAVRSAPDAQEHPRLQQRRLHARQQRLRLVDALLGGLVVVHPVEGGGLVEQDLDLRRDVALAPPPSPARRRSR